jgi:1-acyl-sn-glycerol-3-phosphate acyltransferase
LSIDRVDQWWEARSWNSAVPALRPLFLGACRRFVRSVRLLDPDAIAGLHGTPLLLVANHQVGIESMLAGVVLPAVIGRPITIVAKQEHRETWVGGLALGLNDERQGPAILFVDRDRQEEFLDRLVEMSGLARSGLRSLLVHVEGTRALHGGRPVTTMSAAWADLAIQAGAAIVPLRFCGGLPRSGVAERLEFPFGFGAQDMVLGRPIPAQALLDLNIRAQRERILAALAELEACDVEPVSDPAFAARVRRAQQRWGLDETRAVFLLLQADAQGWPLDPHGLPDEAMAGRDAGDPFWAWFDSHAARTQLR